MRNDIIKRAVCLLKLNDSLYDSLNVDKSKATLKLKCETRCELRRRKTASESNLIIKGGHIVIKAEMYGKWNFGKPLAE